MGKHVSKRDSTVLKVLKKSVVTISEYEDKKDITVTDYLKIATSALILFIINLFKVHGIVELLAFLIPFFLVSYDMFLSVVKKTYKGTFPEDEALVLGCSILCFAIGSYTEAVVIVIAYKVCVILSYLLEKKKESLDELVVIGSIGECKVLSPYGTEVKRIEDVHSDDIIIVESDCIVPVDGVIETGRGAFDYSVFTGEDTLINLKPGDYVAEGCINVSGSQISLRVLSEHHESSGYVLNGMVRNACKDSSVLEKLIYRAVRIFSLVCIPIAVITAIIPGIITDMWFDWISRAVIILFISQSRILRELILYIFDSGIIKSALNGIYIKSNKIIERLCNTVTFVFEKTGVITEGEYEIRKIVPAGISESELLSYAAKAESQSDHPLAKALKNNVDRSVLNRLSIDRYTEYPGRGVSAYINGSKVYAGKYTFVSGFSEPHTYTDSAGTAVHLCINGKYSGYISFGDKIKEGAFDALEKLRAARAGKLVMLTGDSAVSSRKLAAALNFDMIKSEVSPEDKKNSLDYLIKNKNKGTYVTYVGNSRTDRSILESAEVVVTYCTLYEYPLVNDSSDVLIFGKSINKIAETVGIADAVVRKERITSLVFGSVKLLIILLGLTGILPVLPAVITDTAVKILLALYVMFIRE